MIFALLLDLSGTIITLDRTEQPGAIAEVRMYNHAANGPHDEGNHLLELSGLQVWVAFDWDRNGDQADAIHVSPPDGIICEPSDCILELEEGAKGVLYLYDWRGM